MKRKGISPLIAAVLLIAFTMAVASLFAQWAPQLIQNAQGDTSNRTDEIQECSSVSLELINPSVNQTTVRQATGDKDIGNVSVTWFYNNNDPLQNYTTLSGVGSADRIVVAGGGGASPSITDSSRDLDQIVAQAVNCEGSGSATHTPP